MDRGRCERVGDALRRHRGWVEGLEERDPQYRAICALRGLYEPGRLLALTILNAVVSYRLTSTGEEYWWEFSRYMAARARENLDPVDMVSEFIAGSRGNRLGLKAKLARLSKMRGLVADILSGGTPYLDLGEVWRGMYAALGAAPNSKTIVFAVKMGRYALKCYGLSPRVPGIPIPVDIRVASLSLTSGVVAADRVDRGLVKRVVGEGRGVAQRAWGIVSEFAGIPPIVLDSVVWLLGGAARRAGCRRDRLYSVASGEPYLAPREVVEEMFALLEVYRGVLPVC